MAISIESKKPLATTIKGYNSIREIFVNEGRYATVGNDLTLSWTNPTPGQTTNISAINLPYNKAMWIDRVYLTCSRNVKFDVLINYVSNPAPVGTNPYIIVPGRCFANGTWEKVINNYLLGSLVTQIVFRIWEVDISAPNTPVEFAWGIDAYSLFEDTNFFAEGTIAWMGDSISNGTGPTVKTSFYPFLVKKQIEARNFNRRLSIRAFNGCTSAWIDTQADAGSYLWPNVTSFFYALGTNDASQSLSADAFKANVKKMIARVRNNFPGAPIYIIPPPPLANDTYEANAAVMGMKAQEAVSEDNWNGASNNPNYSKTSLSFYLGGVRTAFNRTIGSNYLESAAQQGVHPSNVGSEAIASSISTVFSSIETQIGGNYKLKF